MIEAKIFSAVPLVNSDEGILCVPIANLCKVLGIDWSSVSDRLMAYDGLRFSEIDVAGKRNIGMPVRSFPLFFALVQPLVQNFL